MKTKKKNYYFSEKELEIAREIAYGSRSLVELRNRLSIKPNLLTYYLRKLEEKEIVGLEKCFYSPQRNSEPRKIIAIRGTEHALLLRELFQKLPPISWEKVLSESGLEMLLQATAGSDMAAIPSTTFRRYCKRLENLGVMTRNDGVYKVKNDLFELLEFVAAYRCYILRKQLSSVSMAETKILWHKGSEFLIKVPKGKDIAQEGFRKAATSLLPNFRIATVTDFDVYLYSNGKRELSVEETILHILLIDRGNAHYTTYSYLLLQKELKNIDEDVLRRNAELYDLSDEVNRLLKIAKVRYSNYSSIYEDFLSHL